MSAKTKIVVLHMKELIYTGIFVALGILLVILLITVFTSKDTETESPITTPPTAESGAKTSEVPTASTTLYIPGIYTTELVLGGQMVDVEVILSETSIESIRLINLTDAVTTMYPLLQPTFDTLCEQILATQSLDTISYTSESKYTSLVLLEAIRNSADKGNAEMQTETEAPQ